MSVLSKPFKYQRHGARLIDYFDGRALLADDPGLGKTLTSLMYWQWYLEDVPGPVIIICPANLKINWKREIRKHLGMGAEILYGRTPEPDATIDLQDQVYIINYDILGRCQPSLPKKNRDRSWANYLLELEPKLIIADEIHYCRNRSAQRTKAVKALVRAVPRAVAISGTPIINRPAELFAVANMLWPDTFPNFVDFAFQFCDARKRPWGWEYKGHKNLDQLHALLGECGMIRRRKADVLDQLPAKTRTVVPFDLPDMTEYNTAVTDFLVWLNRTAPEMSRAAARMERMAQMGELRRLAGRLKLPLVIQWVEDFLELTGEKLILFGWHKKVLHAVEAHFGKRCVRVDGSVGVDNGDRQRATDRFNLDPACRLFVGNIQAAGTGWSCTSTSNVAFCELAWTPGEHIQAEDRIHGLERGLPGAKAVIHYLVANDTIEIDLVSTLQKKQAVLDQTLDGGTTDDGIDIYDLLAQQLERKYRSGRMEGHPRVRR